MAASCHIGKIVFISTASITSIKALSINIEVYKELLSKILLSRKIYSSITLSSKASMSVAFSLETSSILSAC